MITYFQPRRMVFSRSSWYKWSLRAHYQRKWEQLCSWPLQPITQLLGTGRVSFVPSEAYYCFQLPLPPSSELSYLFHFSGIEQEWLTECAREKKISTLRKYWKLESYLTQYRVCDSSLILQPKFFIWLSVLTFHLLPRLLFLLRQMKFTSGLCQRQWPPH